MEILKIYFILGYMFLAPISIPQTTFYFNWGPHWNSNGDELGSPSEETEDGLSEVG
jgi:hypothetical protein